MSAGKGGGSSQNTTTVQLTQEQKDLLKAQTKLYTDTLIPTYQQTVQGAKDIYGRTADIVGGQAQTGREAANAAAGLLGGAGASALTTGLSGLAGLFDKNYESEQVNAALQPGEEQYAQDVAGLGAQFGAGGQAGSARQYLAGANLAGLQEQRRGNIRANVRGQIAGQRQNVGQFLTQTGAGGIGAGLNALSTAQQFAGSPLDYYNKYAGVVYGTPSGATPNFSGTQGSSSSGSKSGWNVGINTANWV
jgi:hypothetical protein